MTKKINAVSRNPITCKSWPVGEFQMSTLTAAEVRANFNSPPMKALLADKEQALEFLVEIGAVRPKRQKPKKSKPNSK